MPNPDLIQALAETGQGLKKLVSAVGDEMKSRSDQHGREGQHDRRAPEKFDGTGEETFRLLVCTRDMSHYYLPTTGSVQAGDVCPTCRVSRVHPGFGMLRQVETTIVTI